MKGIALLVSGSPPFLPRRFHRFVYVHIPRRRRGEGQSSRRGGLPAFAGVVLAVVLVFSGEFHGFLRPFALGFVSAGRRHGREMGGGD